MLLGLLSALPVRYVDYHVLVHTLFKEKRVYVNVTYLHFKFKLYVRAMQFEGAERTSAWAAHFALPVSITRMSWPRISVH